MALKLYPLGIQTFERIRKENKLYIDKTEYVYRLTHTSGTYFFLGRPRRFGKSLFLTTLQSYFEGKIIAYLGNLGISARKTYSMVLPSKSWKRSGQNILCSTLI